MFNLLFVASIISFSTLFSNNSRTWALSRHHCHRIWPPRGASLLAPYWERRRRGGIQTRDLSIKRRALHHWSATATLPCNNLNCFSDGMKRIQLTTLSSVCRSRTSPIFGWQRRHLWRWRWCTGPCRCWRRLASLRRLQRWSSWPCQVRTDWKRIEQNIQVNDF